jgi:hypothetical protein
MLLLCGCSGFNMSPPCDETGPGLMRQLAVPADVRPDPAKLAAIMTVSGFEELGSSYNARTCRAEVAGGTSRATVTYNITQSEGVQGWYVIELENATSPDVQMLIQEVRSAYAEG